MKVRGWVFVVTNPVVPDLCRITFSVKQPSWRARQMSKESPEQPFIVEYAVSVDNPHWYKLIACRKLEREGRHEWKEWFRCPPEDAAVAIREAIGKNRIFSETIRGVEHVKRSDPGASGGSASETIAASRTGIGEREGTGEEMSDPARTEGYEERDSVELAAAIRKAIETPVISPRSSDEEAAEKKRDERSGGDIEEVLSVARQSDAAKEELSRLQEEKRRREKREEVQQDAEKVRRRMEEIKKTEQEPAAPAPVREKNFSVSKVKAEEPRSMVWEMLLLALTDMGCFYIIFAAKSLLITLVAVILSTFFTLFLIDMIKGHLRKAKEKKQSSP